MPKPLSNNQSLLVTKPVPLSLFPTMDSIGEVVTFAESKLPICSKNEVITLLGTYHNTLLKQFSTL